MTIENVAKSIREKKQIEEIVNILQQLQTLKEQLQVLIFFPNEEKEDENRRRFAEAFYSMVSKNDTLISHTYIEGQYENYLIVLDYAHPMDLPYLVEKLEKPALLNLLANAKEHNYQNKNLVTQICDIALSRAIREDDLDTAHAISSHLDNMYRYNNLVAAKNVVAKLINWARPNTLQEVNGEFHTQQAKSIIHREIANYLAENNEPNGIIKQYLEKYHRQFIEYLLQDRINYIRNINVLLTGNVIDIIKGNKEYLGKIANLITADPKYSALLHHHFYNDYICDIAHEAHGNDKSKLNKLIYEYISGFYIINHDIQVDKIFPKVEKEEFRKVSGENIVEYRLITKKMIDYILKEKNSFIHQQDPERLKDFLANFLKIAITAETPINTRAEILALIATSQYAKSHLNTAKTSGVFTEEDIKAASEMLSHHSTARQELLEVFTKKEAPALTIIIPEVIVTPNTTTAEPAPTSKAEPEIIIAVPEQPKETPAPVPDATKIATPIKIENFDPKPISSEIMKLIAERFFIPSPPDKNFENLLQEAIKNQAINVKPINGFAKKFVDELKTDKSIFIARDNRSWPQFFKDLLLKIYSVIFGTETTGKLRGEGTITFSKDFDINKLNNIMDKIVKQNEPKTQAARSL